jgi:hypothetical protein
MSRKKRGHVDNRPRRRNETTPFVSVYCAGTETESHAKWRIGSLLPNVADAVVRWGAVGNEYYDPNETNVIRVRRTVTQFLDGTTWVESGVPFGDGDARVRWLFKCDECGMARAVARPEDMFEALSAVHAAGIREVELIHFVHARHAG